MTVLYKHDTLIPFFIHKKIHEPRPMYFNIQIYFLPRILPNTNDTIAITRIAPINAGKI